MRSLRSNISPEMEYSLEWPEGSAFTYATHCSALEAALDIDAQQSGVGDRFTEALIGVYGVEPTFTDFFYGLYVARSLFVHGIAPHESNRGQSKESLAYRFFTNVRCKVTLMRAITRDVIRHALGREISALPFISHDSALPLLRTVLHSDDLWTKVRRLLTQSKAAEKILGMGEQEFEQIHELAERARDSFAWQCVREEVKEHSLRQSLRTCALLIAHLTNSQGDVYLESDRLGSAAEQGDDTALRNWVLGDTWHYVWLQSGDRLSVVQVIARSLARYFYRNS